MVNRYDMSKKNRDDESRKSNILFNCNNLKSIIRKTDTYTKSVLETNDNTHIVHLKNHLKMNHKIVFDYYNEIMSDMRSLNKHDDKYVKNIQEVSKNIRWLLFEYYDKIIVLESVNQDDVKKLSDKFDDRCICLFNKIDELK